MGEKVAMKESEDLNMAGKIASEVLSAIKTVVAYGGQEKEIQRYRQLPLGGSTLHCMYYMYNNIVSALLLQ